MGPGSGERRKVQGEYLKGVLATLAASVLWGTTGTSASFVVGASAFAVGAAAMGGGGLLQALRGWPAVRRNLPGLKKNFGLLFAAALGVMVYPLAFYESMRLSGVTVGTVVSIGAAPFFTALIERFVLGTRITRLAALGMAMGVAGVAMISVSGRGSAGVGTSGAMLLGLVSALVAALTYAWYSFAAGLLIRRGIPGKAAMGAEFGLGALMLLPVLFVTGGPLLEHAVNMVSVGYMIVVPMFLGYILFGAGLARIPASTAVGLSLLEPAVAALLAATVVGERLPVLALAGVATVFASLVLMARRN